MRGKADKPNRHRLQRWLFAAFVLLLPLHGLLADEALKRRVQVGLKLFPAVLAASESLEQEPANNSLRVLIVYHDDRAYAEELANSLLSIDRIKGIPLMVDTAPIGSLSKAGGTPPFAIFVCQRNETQLHLITEYAQQHGVITFSPFRGDVERGILAGVAISDRILPLINRKTLDGLPFGLKVFFLRIAEIHEP